MPTRRSTVRLHSSFAEVEGLLLHARVHADAPRAPEVVLVHGVGVSSRNMVPAAEALAAECRVHAIDLPGHGRSEDPPGIPDIAGLADYVAAWARSVGIAGAAFLGNSVGCQIVADLASRFPELARRVVLQGPTIDPSGRGLVRQLSRWLINGYREPAEQRGITLAD